MGEGGKGYDATVYESKFTGRMTIEQTDEITYTLYVTELYVGGEVDTETIVGRTRTVTTLPYGLALGDVFTLYMPGASGSLLTDEQITWLFGDVTDPLSELALCSITQDYAFNFD